VRDHLRDHAAEPVTDRDGAGTVELRRLHVQQVVDAPVRLAALDFVGCLVVEPRVRPVVVVVDVAADPGSGVVEVSYSFSHTSRSLSLPNQLSMKAWLSGSR